MTAEYVIAWARAILERDEIPATDRNVMLFLAGYVSAEARRPSAEVVPFVPRLVADNSGDAA